MDEMRRFVGIDVAKVVLDVFIGSVGRGILRTRYSVMTVGRVAPCGSSPLDTRELVDGFDGLAVACR